MSASHWLTVDGLPSRKPPLVIIVEGPDACGKTEVVRALSQHYGVPSFKANTERKNWRHGTFKDSLAFDLLLPQFIETTRPAGIVFDRSYPSEWVYSIVFNRETDEGMLVDVDREFERLGAVHVILLRRDYSTSRADDLVPADKLQALDRVYRDHFVKWTKCKTVVMYVDDYENDIRKQLPVLTKSVREATR